MFPTSVWIVRLIFVARSLHHFLIRIHHFFRQIEFSHSAARSSLVDEMSNVAATLHEFVHNLMAVCSVLEVADVECVKRRKQLIRLFLWIWERDERWRIEVMDDEFDAAFVDKIAVCQKKLECLVRVVRFLRLLHYFVFQWFDLYAGKVTKSEPTERRKENDKSQKQQEPDFIPNLSRRHIEITFSCSSDVKIKASRFGAYKIKNVFFFLPSLEANMKTTRTKKWVRFQSTQQSRNLSPKDKLLLLHETYATSFLILCSIHSASPSSRYTIVRNVCSSSSAACCLVRKKHGYKFATYPSTRAKFLRVVLIRSFLAQFSPFVPPKCLHPKAELDPAWADRHLPVLYNSH